MANYFSGIMHILDQDTDTYNSIIIARGEKGEKGDSPTTDEIKAQVTTEVAKIVANAPADFDTLKEIADWIDSHEDDAAAMNSAINTNTGNISTNTSNIATINSKLGIEVSGTLSAGDTSITLESNKITSTSIIDPYTDEELGVETEAISYLTKKVETGKVTFTFDARDTDLTVGITVR